VTELPDFLALDFETTGRVGGLPSRPWQLGAISVRQRRIDPEGPRFDTYLRVPLNRPFAPRTPGDHRRNREAIAAAPEPEACWPALHAVLQSAVPVAHNVATERTILRELAPMTRYHVWVDTLRLARLAWPGLSSYALEALVPALGLLERLQHLVPGRAPHDAYYDAVAAALLLETLLAAPGWENITLQDLAAP